MVKNGFKQTEIGLIPEDWSIIDFEEISTMNGRIGWQGLKQDEFTFNYDEPFLITGMNFKDGKIRWDEVYHISEERYKQAKQIQLKTNDILMTKDGTIGKLLYVDDIPFPKKASLNSHLLVFRPKNNTYNPKFMFYQLHGKHFLQHIELTKSGSTFFGISQESMGKYKAILPTQEEQKSIAKALSDTDELISSLEKLISKKEAIKQGTMQQLLTGKKRLSGFSGEWEEKKIGRDCTLKARIGWQGLTTSEYKDSGDYYLVTGTDFENGLVNWDTCHFVDKWRFDQDKNIQIKVNDVLITKDGTIGKAGFVETLKLPATLNSGVFVIRSKSEKIDQKYLYYIFTSEIFDDFLNKLTAGSTINHLYQKDFINFTFKAPQEKEQKAIAKALFDMDNEIEFLKSKLSKTQAIKNGMMSELLTGKIRLKV